MFREKEGGKEGKRYPHVLASHMPPQVVDLAHNPGTCPDWESNPQPFDSQAGAQSTEPHQSPRFFKCHHHCGTGFCHSAILDPWFNKTHCFPLSCFVTLFYCSNPPIASCEQVLKRSILFYFIFFF